MYICDFSRSDGAGNATSRNTRGLTRSVMALMVPPLPAASRPSKMMIARRPLYLTHSWSLHSSPWSLPNSFSYFLALIFSGPFGFDSLLMGFGCLSVSSLAAAYGGRFTAFGLLWSAAVTGQVAVAPNCAVGFSLPR